MSVESVPRGAAWRTWAGEVQQRWQEAAPSQRTRVQVAILLASVVVAYHYSLKTLIQNLGVDTPLAYVGLVPAIALGLAAALRHPRQEPAIHDRQLDYIIGLPLIASAVFINMVVPGHLSDLYWIWRLDLLTLPLFVAGVVTLLFGVRVLWRQKIAIVYLVLAWPLPYTMLLLNILNDFTNATISALKAVLKVIPVAHPIAGSDGSLFSIVHNGRAFPLSVVSACSGVNGVVGFLLVGAAFGVLVQGPRLRKLLWLAGGMFLLWGINIGRLVFIFWAGRTWGEQVAINVLHPFVGLVTYCLGVAIMLLSLGPLGLRLGPEGQTHAPSSGGAPRPALRAFFPAVGIVVLAALILGVQDSNLKQYDMVANAAGEPKLASYSLNPAAPDGWKASFYTSYTWAQPFFGSNSTWYRFVYDPTGAPTALHSSLPVTADVINSTQLNSFSAYGVQACYQFHGYKLRDAAQVTLGGGIKGEALSWSSGNHGDWSMLYWIWPIKSSGATHFERVILYLQDIGRNIVSVSGPVTGIRSLQGALRVSDPNDVRLINERAFLVDFARDVVRKQAAVTPGSQLPGLALAMGFSENTPAPISNAAALARAQRLGYHLPAHPRRRMSHQSSTSQSGK
jgi:exosortase/archaeosortase family protein